MRKLFYLLLGFVLLFSIYSFAIAEDPKDVLKVHFLDVGHGDAILVQAPEGKTMLVDGGTKEYGDEVVSFLKEKGVKQLDYVIATHPDADHIGGLIKVFKTFPVNRFINSGKVHTTETYKDLLTVLKDNNISYFIPKVLETYKLDPRITVQVLHVNEEAKETNDASLVLKLTYNKVSFLLMADASTEIEEDIRKKYDVEATVLKVGHHGSDTSSSAPFISSVDPKVAILSFERGNTYGHPDVEVVKRLKSVGAKIYKTGTHCDITVSTNGVKYVVTTDCPKRINEKSTSTS